MSSEDFVLVEVDQNSSTPLIDNISIKRLHFEWSAVMNLYKEHSDVSVHDWKIVIKVYRSLYKTSPGDCRIFMITAFTDMLQVLQNMPKNLIQAKSYMKSATRLFLNLLKIYDQHIKSLPRPPIIYFFQNFNNFIDYNEKTFLKVLDASLEPLCLDEFVYDGSIPFFKVLLKNVTLATKCGTKCRALIEQIITTNRMALKIFYPLFFESMINLIFDYLNPSHMLMGRVISSAMIKWPSNVTNLINDSEAVALFCKLFKGKILDDIYSSNSCDCLTKLNKLIPLISETRLLVEFIQKILDQEGLFVPNISEWSLRFPVEYIKLLLQLLDIRCGAIQCAFFFLPDLDVKKAVYDFPDLPTNEKMSVETSQIPSALTYSIYSQVVPDLRKTYPHIKSVLPDVITMFSSFWSLSPKAAELVTELITRFAATNTSHAYGFCFTPGVYIYAETAKLIRDINTARPELKNIMKNFVVTMNLILNGMPPPLK